MAPEGVLPGIAPPPPSSRIKAYHRTKLIAGLVSTGLSLCVLWLLVTSGATRDVVRRIDGHVGNDYLLCLLVFGFTAIATGVLTFPIGFYSGFVIEHRFGLSNQSFWGWIWEHVKGLLVAVPLGSIAVILVYFSMNTYGSEWWIVVGIGATLISIVLARLAPVVLFPLFYKFTPLHDGEIRERILALCGRAGVRVEGLFTFNLSKNTRKANAAVTGIGRSKRIVIGDTLMAHFSGDEIETVCAHELGHFKHRHILWNMVMGTLMTFGGLWMTSLAYEWALPAIGFDSVTDIAALPLLGFWYGLFGIGTGPVVNLLSRRHEQQADEYAVRATGKRDAFVTALRRLEVTNMADADPHPLVEFLFHSHPSIGRRIRAIEAVAGG